MTDLIVAQTHPPEYLLHKYWSRKPHNVLAHFLHALVPEGGRVLDPFAGSGVFISEAARSGFEATGFDINPIAVLLSRVTLDPPDVAAFAERAEAVLDELLELTKKAYGCPTGDPVKYVVHATECSCPRCSRRWIARDATRVGRTYRCPDCNERIYFNLERLLSTRVIEVVTEAAQVVTDRAELLGQEKQSDKGFGSPTGCYDFPFTTNRRTLAFEGLKTSNLFTHRNFTLLSTVADQFHEESDPRTRDALLLMLTASVAQCSRLIPYRGRMSGGGPAWSVPGFWVPPVHLETNPYVHLRARLRKFERGLRRLQARPLRAPGAVVEGDAVQCLAALNSADERYDLVFLDPPYGDSVPYVEFSELWNSFLQTPIDPRADLSVSDRAGTKDSWQQYRDGLRDVVAAASKVLAPHGTLLITFNSHDDRAWQALLAALQANDFRCRSVAFQQPAVVSAKAQFSVEGSYVGDFYCIYEKAPLDFRYSRSLASLKVTLARLAASREGRPARNVVRRTVITNCMENNISVELVDVAFRQADELFEARGDSIEWHGDTDIGCATLKLIAARVAQEHAARGSFSWAELCSGVAREAASVGVPDSHEIRSVLADVVEVVGKAWRWCPAYQGAEDRQLDLQLQ